MADLIEIGVSFVDKGDGMKKAVSTVSRLESQLLRLVKAQAMGKASTERLHQSMVIAGRELKKNSDLTGGEAWNSIQKYVAAQKKSIAASEGSTTATNRNSEAVRAYSLARKQATDEDRRRDAVLKSNTAALNQQREANRANTAEVNKYRMATNSVYAAEQKLLKLKGLLRTEVANGNMTMREAAAVQMQYKQSLAVMGNGLNQTARKTNQLGVMMQQTGYQVGDFAVQVSSGQNVMVAFGQQATQLVGTMAMFAKTTKMIALFSGLGIAIPIISGIAAAFMRMGDASKEAGEKAEEAKKGIKNLNDAIDALGSNSRATSLDITNYLSKAFGSLSVEVQNLIEDLRQAEFSVISKKMRVEIESATQELTRLGGAFEVFWQDFMNPNTVESGYLDQTKQIIKDAGLAYEEFVRLDEAVKNVFSATTTNEFISALAEARSIALDLGGPTGEAVAEALLKSAKEAGVLSRVLGEAGGAAEDLDYKLSGVVQTLFKIVGIDLASGFDYAAMSVSNLNSRLDRTLSKIGSILGALGNIGFDTIAIQAEIKALKAGQSLSQARIEAQLARARAESTGGGEGGALTEFELTAMRLALEERAAAEASLAAEINKRTDADSEATRGSKAGANATKKAAEALKKEVDALNLAADATAKYKHEYDKLLKLKDAGLSEQAFAKEVAKLNEELANSSPVLNGFIDAFSDFLGRGARDFKTFAKDILNMFKDMIIKMIAMAVKNKIMLSVGMGGSTLASAAAAGGVPGVGSAAGSGLMGNFIGGFGAAGAAGTGLLGGIGSVASGVMSGGISGGIGAIGTALSGATSGLAGFGAALGAVALPLLAVTAVFSFFKTKVKELDTGLRITADGAGTLVEEFRKIEKKRFWGLSKKTSETYKEMEDSSPIVSAIDDIKSRTMQLGDILGLTADNFASFSSQIKISLKGLSEEQAQAEIQRAFGVLAEQFTYAALGSFQEQFGNIIREGETAVQALESLAISLQSVNTIFDTLGFSLYEASVQGGAAARSFADLFGGIENLNSVSTAYYQEFYSEQERLDTLVRQTTVAFDAMNSTLPKTREEFRKLVEAQDLSTESGREMVAALMQLSPAFVQIVDGINGLAEAAYQASVNAAEAAARAARDAYQDAMGQVREAESGVSAAFDRLRDSIAAAVEKLQVSLSAANERLSYSREIFDLLTSTVRDRRRTNLSEDMFSRSRQSAVSFLRTGNVSDKARLEDSLSVVSEPSEQLFGSFTDYARDFLRTGRIIEDLEKTAGVQLSADEQAVKALEDQIEQAESQMDIMRDQYDALLGIDKTLLTIPEAIANLGSSIQGLISANAAAAAAKAAAEQAEKVKEDIVVGGGGGAVATPVLDLYRDMLGRAADAAGLEFWRNTGLTGQALTDAFRQGAVQNEEVPMFANGGMHSGGYRIVGERGPELEATGPSRIMDNRRTQSLFQNPELVSEIRSLRSEVAGLRGEQLQIQTSNSKYVKRNYDINRKWDTDGLPATRT